MGFVHKMTNGPSTAAVVEKRYRYVRRNCQMWLDLQNVIYLPDDYSSHQTLVMVAGNPITRPCNKCKSETEKTTDTTECVSKISMFEVEWTGDGNGRSMK